MKRIIIFPGKMDNVFFLKEIEYFTQEFDQVLVYTQPGESKKYHEISQKYGIEYRIIQEFTKSSIARSVLRLITEKDSREEFRRSIKRKNGKKNSVKCMLACLSFFFLSNREYQKDKSIQYEDYLYSFWLERGAYAVARIAKENNIKYSISRAHGFDLYEERNIAHYQPFRQYLIQYLNEIAFISEQGLQYFKNHYHITNAKLSVFRLGTVNEEKRRKQNKLSKKKVCIASCSNVELVKRIDLVIDELSKLWDDFMWIHIGDGPLLEQMKSIAEKKLKKEQYLFLGKVANEYILDTYEKYDVDYLLNFSDSEGLPVSFMEAMSMGIPVIARNVGGNGEIVSNDCGRLLEQSDDYAKEISKMIAIRKEETSYRTLSQHAKEKWETEFSAQVNYQGFIDHIIGC